jgi:hypothetical protein
MTNRENDGKLYFVKPNTQVTHADLKLGIGSICLSKDINVDIEIPGKFCLYIWPFIKNEDKGRPAILIYEGITVNLKSFTLEIIEINKEGIKMKIR